MMVSTSFALENRLFLKARSGISVLIIVAVLCCIAAFAGRTQMERVEAAQTAFLSEKVTKLTAWRQGLMDLETTGSAPSPYVARPMDIRMPAVLLPAALGDFAAGAAGLYPTTASISGWLNPADLFAAYEFANPRLLALGGFDLSFLVVVIMPLFMIAIAFDVVPGERQTGRLRLLSIQAGQIRTSTWTRLIIRNGALWAVFTIVTLLLAAAPAGDAPYGERLGGYAVWLVVALLYGVFWFAMIAAANMLLKRAETVAASLFAAWAVFVFAVPTLGGAVAEATYPPPSRLAFLSEMRQGEVMALRQTAALTAGFLADHPEMTVSDEAVPAYYSANFLANQEAGRRTTPVLEAFKRSRNDRAKLLGVLHYVSPAMIVDSALKSIAGGHPDRYLAYQDQAVAALLEFRQTIGPAVVAKQRLSLAQFEAIPPFSFQEASSAAKLGTFALPLGYLLSLSALLFALAARRLAAPLEEVL